jgi:pimeloyl-ACP methyl ester carboxylesterase
MTHPPDSLWSEEIGDQLLPLVLLIHGSMDRSAGMLKLSRRLDHQCRVLRYDRRGYGRSRPHHGPFDMPAQVGDALAMLAGRRAVIFGHSYGGNVALAVAATVPDQVIGVAVYETPLSWEPWWPGSTAGAAAVAAADQPELAAERFMRRIVGDERWESLPERTQQVRRAEGVAMVGELADLRANRPWTATQITVPVRAGFGSRGAPHHRTGMEHLVAEIASATLCELHGCGHDAPMRHPDLVVTEMVEPLLAADDHRAPAAPPTRTGHPI